MNIRTILFGTDFSEASDPAFRVAQSLARDNDAKLLVLYVSEMEDYPVGEHVDEEPRPPKSETDQLEALVARAEGVACEWRWVHGEPPHEAEAIIQAAQKESADVIIAGTHGRRGLAHLLTGSVAEKLIREAPCPVLTVRGAKASAK